MGPRPKTVKERFLKKIKKDDDPLSCWIWTGARDNHGYGQLTVGSMTNGTRRREKAHRISYELFVGPIPTGLTLLHSCDNPPCCNPAHLSLGSQKQNVEDMIRKGRNKCARGEGKSNSVLSDDMVRMIRKIYTQGQISQRKVGKILGVNENTVKAVLGNRSWKHVI